MFKTYVILEIIISSHHNIYIAYERTELLFFALRALRVPIHLIFMIHARARILKTRLIYGINESAINSYATYVRNMQKKT